MAATAETLYTRNSRDVFSRIIAMHQYEGIASYMQQQSASKSGTHKEETPLTEGTPGKAEVPATAHSEQQGHQKSTEIIETPMAIRTSTSAGSTATAKIPILAKYWQNCKKLTDVAMTKKNIKFSSYKRKFSMEQLQSYMCGRPS
jgi:hypothetical protein